MSGVLARLAVAQLALLLTSCGPVDPDTGFTALLEAQGAEYTRLRDDLLAQEADSEVLAAGATRAARGDQRAALQLAILEAWRDRPQDMRAVAAAIEDWRDLPSVATRTGERVLRTPLAPFEGREEALTLSLLEILLHYRGTEQFLETEQLDAVFYFLGDLRDEVGTPLLLDIAADPEESIVVRADALEALATIGATRTIGALAESATGDPESPIRQLAVAALGQTESPEALPVLERVVAAETDARVRAEAEAAIEYIEVYRELEDEGPLQPPV